MTQKFILAVSVVLATLVVTELTIYDAGYRLPGVELLVLGQAGDITTDHAPLPVYAAWFGYEFGGGEVGVARLNALAIGIAVSITALVSWHLAGLWAAMTTALIFLCFPGTLFHARTMGPEAISMLAMALLLAASVMDLARIRSVVLACVAMTAALACTPETSALAIVWLLLCKKNTTPREIPVRGRIDVGTIPPGALLPVLVAPVALIGLWPHLHSQTGDRLAQYLLGNFFAPHPPIMVLSSWIDQTVSRGPSVFSGLLLFMQKVPLIVAILAVAGGIIYRAKASKAVGLWVALILTHVLNGSPYYAGIDGMAFHTPFLALLSRETNSMSDA